MTFLTNIGRFGLIIAIPGSGKQCECIQNNKSMNYKSLCKKFSSSAQSCQFFHGLQKFLLYGPRADTWLTVYRSLYVTEQGIVSLYWGSRLLMNLPHFCKKFWGLTNESRTCVSFNLLLVQGNLDSVHSLCELHHWNVHNPGFHHLQNQLIFSKN